MGGTLRRCQSAQACTYKLDNEDGEELTNAWNIQQLRRFYHYKGFLSFFCNLHTQHPSWLYKCKFPSN
jgi:hypothetical protein